MENHFVELSFGLLSLAIVGLVRWISSTSKRVTEHGTMIGNLTDEFGKTNNRVDEISNRCHQRQVDYGKIQGQLEGISYQLDDLKTAIHDLTKKVYK